MSDKNYFGILTVKKHGPAENVIKCVKKAKNVIDNVRLSEILMKNPYEKLVPVNLWFNSSAYHTENYYENNQNIRIRYFNSSMLTPLVACNENNLAWMKGFVDKLSLYQPYYPETFYTMWEFLKMQYLGLGCNKFLHIGRQEKLGSMEAIIFFHEKYQMTYQYNKYHCWLVGKEMYDRKNGAYKMMKPEINYLEQAYKIHFLDNTQQLIKYDFISIDSNHLFSSIFDWKEQELDLQALLFYMITAMENLAPAGSMIIKLNMIANKSWNIIFDICLQNFKEYEFFRPTISNPFNSEIYLFVSKYTPKEIGKSVYYEFLKNLYRNKIYLLYNINAITSAENPITLKYQKFTNEWCFNLETTTKDFNKKSDKTIDYVTQWHQSNDLKQISDLSKDFDNNTMECEIRASILPDIKLTLPDKLYKLSVYKKLIDKRAELNYYKRVMDTKPNQLFVVDNKYSRDNYLLTWEQLSNEIDIYKNLKHTLRAQYQAEMVTNAWIKMYEIINIIKNLIPIKEIVKSFHLCEAPGAFVSATNHYISNRGTGTLDWYAQTLRKTNTGQESDVALSDHFGLIAEHREKWLFGNAQDNSGDITHSTVIKSYMSNPLLKDIDFMTSDAGLQCDPAVLNEQEAYLGKINMGQIVCILACLPPGKSAIFKTFLPMSEPLTISLMYLVTNLFKKVNIIKPSSSHSSNSEVYVAVQDYKGINKGILDILFMLLDDPNITSKTLLFNQIDTIFFNSYMKNINNLIDRQIKSLCRNYYYYYHLEQIPEFAKIAEKCTEKWLLQNPVFVLKNKLLTNSNNNRQQKSMA